MNSKSIIILNIKVVQIRVVQIEDVEPDTFELLLEFIYKGEIFTQTKVEIDTEKNVDINWLWILD